MSRNEGDTMASVMNSLSESLRGVPPAAVPAVLDCIIASTGLSSSSLFDYLLDTVANITRDTVNKDAKLDGDQCDYLSSLVGGLCYLLKQIGVDPDAMKSFIWRSFVPLIITIPAVDRKMLLQIVDYFIDVVIETNTWTIVEATLVPFLLLSAALSMNILAHENLKAFELDKCSAFWLSSGLITKYANDLKQENLHGRFPLPVACHILTAMLDSSLQIELLEQTSELVVEDRHPNCKAFTLTMIWELSNVAEQLLLQSSDNRACAINFLLPTIFKAFYSHCIFEISIKGQTCMLSRNCFLKKIWKCCKTLFSSGPLERRDAYSILSLYLCFFPGNEGCEDAGMCDTVDKFDITAEKDFWDEIKRGLVDKEGLVRKQCLHVLKKILRLTDDSQCHDSPKSSVKKLNGSSLTRREGWASKEAKSLGVGKICNQIDVDTNGHKHWQVFVLLYEMLEEYGTHLIEAAWNHQVSLFLQISVKQVNSSKFNGGVQHNQLETSGEISSWLSILWERGFHHDNPLVRCLIMRSFLDIKWEDHEQFTGSVPETFVLGPFVQAMNDPVHHKDFGVKGVYSSGTIEGAARFCYQYANCIDRRKRMTFLLNLASATQRHPFSRAGLMGLAECIASVAFIVKTHDEEEAECVENDFADHVEVGSQSETYSHNHKTELLDVLRFVIETSKQHFNPNYRLRVCDKVLEAASSVLYPLDLPLDLLLNFISSLPREFTDGGGALREKVQEWTMGGSKKHFTGSCCSLESNIWGKLHDFPKKFLQSKHLITGSVAYDDEELKAWDFEAKRWSRLVFLALKEEHHITPIITLIQYHGANISMQNNNNNVDWTPMKFLILNLSLVQELQLIQERAAEAGSKAMTEPEFGLCETRTPWKYMEDAIVCEKFADTFLFVLEELVTFASFCCSIFWSDNGIVVEETTLPSSVRGRLGGPSQRRLPSSIASPVLLAITALKTVASILSWITCCKSNNSSINHAFTLLWKFFLKAISPPPSYSEIGAEICLASYEALCQVLPVLVSVFPPQDLDFTQVGKNFSMATTESKSQLDTLVITFLQHINSLLAVGFLARSRQAVLLNWKWLCLESLFSIPSQASQDGHASVDSTSSFTVSTLRLILSDLIENLEIAGEGSVLPMLRLVRKVLRLFSIGKEGVLVSSCNGVDSQMMWQLVRSSWILHVSCNKRRVAHIAALMSSILHSSVFCDKEMHLTNNAQGPLKWFVEKLLEEGTKSPRTLRLAALHLCGMWLTYPWTVSYYLTELKLLSLYGSVAFDEDFEAELADYQTRSEVSLLAKIPDAEMTEAFINTELYARVSVAVLFSKLADLADRVGSENENEDCYAALRCGKMFLLHLLESVVKDNDLSKELYKKYSAIHRRKVRAWQMICVLTRFVGQDIVQQATDSLHICLCRNNLPAVRQYLETFAINLYLKFPFLVGEQLVPILQDYNMRPQALSSYVFIAANVILNASEADQAKHLNELLPPIVPQLTSHHHSLRSFTQVLVYHVLDKIYPKLQSRASETMPLEKRCFDNLKMYLEKNTDCVRLRASMEGYLSAYNPISSITPAGIFISRVDEPKFECVPTCLMEQVLTFLNDVREDLRNSMANDVVTIKTESFRNNEDSSCMEIHSDGNNEKFVDLLPETTVDFQKKITVFKHGKQDSTDGSIFGNEVYRQLLEMENDDGLLHQLLLSRSLSMDGLNRQEFFLVASLVDRIPNLAGLARTCEVFKAAGLVVADLKILSDKQFQLISVTAEKWVPTIEVPVNSVKAFLEKKKREGFSILGLEQTANSVSLDQFIFPKKTVLVLGREKEGIPVDIIHILDACIEIPQLGVVRSLNVHVSGAIALWEYTRQQRCRR